MQFNHHNNLFILAFTNDQVLTPMTYKLIISNHVDVDQCLSNLCIH